MGVLGPWGVFFLRQMDEADARGVGAWMQDPALLHFLFFFGVPNLWLLLPSSCGFGGGVWRAGLLVPVSDAFGE